ncbi:drug-responsive transcription factor [Maudiozyma humilis]|uniref:Drug-responsive transcription factor n=1 Tax=Maudiozyma humilis TaxID=51915 RepID=A0AAV5S015_MAUHU|nr:drug-responsive transcription factor [Kazachstania humilis]
MNCQVYQCQCHFADKRPLSPPAIKVKLPRLDPGILAQSKSAPAVPMSMPAPVAATPVGAALQMQMMRESVPRGPTPAETNTTTSASATDTFSSTSFSSNALPQTVPTPDSASTSSTLPQSTLPTAVRTTAVPAPTAHPGSLYTVNLQDGSPGLDDLKRFTQHNTQFTNGLYEGDIEDVRDYNDLLETLKRLQAMPARTKNLERMLDDTRDKLNEITQNWQPKVNLEKLPDMLQSIDPIDALKSVETQLMINKYRSRVYLSRYSHWSLSNVQERPGASACTAGDPDHNAKGDDGVDAACNGHHIVPPAKAGGYLSSVPLIDEIFGLYHPCEALSLRGIAYLTQKYSVLRPKEKGKDQIIRANVFLLLRFFDLCWLHMNEDRVSIANPLESYLQKTHGFTPAPSTSSMSHASATSPLNPSTGNIPSAPSTPKLNNTNNKEMVATILNGLPPSFVEFLTPTIVHKLLSTLNDDLAMFRLLLQLCGDHKKKIEQQARWIKPDSDGNVSARDLDRFDRLIGVHELLMALCYAYYNATMYYLSHIDTLEYLELLLDMLDYESWAQEIYGFDKILNIAINCALKAGFSRWEYYVGFDEQTAERRRRVWWRLYMYDKKVMMNDSYLSGIDDSKVNCLLPREFRDLGFLDHNDYIKRVHHLPRSDKFDSMSLKSLVFYGRCGMYQVISHFYSEVLYNEKYTSIRNTAKPDEFRLKLIGELFARLRVFMMRFDKIKEQVGRLFEIAENVTEPRFDNLSSEDKDAAVAFLFEYTAAYSLVTRVSINIGIRVSVFPKPAYLKEHVMTLSKTSYEMWVKMNKTMVKLPTPYDLWNVLETYSFTFLLMITWMYDECAYIEHGDIVDVIRVFERLSELKDVFITNADCPRQTLKFFSSLFSLFCVMSRILLTEYVGLDRMTSDAISEIFKDEGEHVVELVKIIFDGNSFCYQLLLTPLEESVFHTSIKKMLKSDYDIKVEENPRTGQGNLSGQQQSQPNATMHAPLPRSASEQVIGTRAMGQYPSTNSDMGVQGPGHGRVPLPGTGTFPPAQPGLGASVLMNTGPLTSNTPPLINNTSNTLLYPPGGANTGTPGALQPNANASPNRRADSSPQIGYIDKRLFQPFDLGILEDFFSTTDFTDLGSL